MRAILAFKVYIAQNHIYFRTCAVNRDSVGPNDLGLQLRAFRRDTRKDFMGLRFGASTAAGASIAEADIKRAEQVCSEVVVPAVNELRYGAAPFACLERHLCPNRPPVLCAVA